MKFTIKQMLALSALAVGASPAFADVYLPSTNNGELTLFVQNQTAGTTYTRGLTSRLDQIQTSGAIQADATNGTYSVGEAVTGFSFGTIAADGNLSSFLGAAGANDVIVWSVVGGDGGNSNNVAEERYVTTTQASLAGGTSVTNGQLRSVYSQLEGVLNTNNGFIEGSALGDGSSTPAGATPFYTSTAENWFGAGPHQASALGSAANFYMLASAGGSTSNNAMVYSLNRITLDGQGNLIMESSSAPVPLPAALWLLGSGLLGMAGVSRRKQQA
jgi:hypothetical protein